MLPIDKMGIVKLGDIEKLIKKNTRLISVTSASSEIGTIQPISEITSLAKHRNVFFHTDAVQSISTMELNLKENSPDAVTLS